MRLVSVTVLCEGPSEEEFVLQVLRPELVSSRVFLKPRPLHRGNFGTVPWPMLRRFAFGLLQRSRPHELITTMIDFYGLSGFPPSPAELAGRAKAEWIEKRMFEELGDPRSIPHLQLHEFEALLFADLESLRDAYPDQDLDRALDGLRKSVGALGPEEIDEGRASSPSKRLIAHVPIYAKAQDGPTTLARIGLPKLMDACPHFANWVTRLRELAAEPPKL